MKKSVAIIVAVSAITATSALAQTNVTMYGVIDTIVRHTNNEINSNGERGSKTVMEQGVFQGPRLGFKGTEDLGGGTSAVFQLEMGFQSDTGASDQQGQLFGRQAKVGIKNKDWGEIAFGRQYGVAFDVLGGLDPLGMGNLTENAWQLFLIGVRFDNTVKYTNSWGPVTAELQYSFGEQPGSASIGSTGGFGLTYDDGILSVGAFDQLSKDANGNKVNIAGIGASYDIKNVILFLNYFNARRDPGFVIGASGTNEPLANTSLAVNNVGNTLRRTDNVYTAGLIYQPTPVWSYTLGYMTDIVKNESSFGNSGRISTVYAVAAYSLSKQTDIYLNLDYTRLSGGEIEGVDNTNTVLSAVGAGMGGARNRTGIAIGLRTRF